MSPAAADTARATFGRALVAEQLRNARRVCAFRFVGISVFVALTWSFRPEQPDHRVRAVRCALAMEAARARRDGSHPRAAGAAAAVDRQPNMIIPPSTQMV